MRNNITVFLSTLFIFFSCSKNVTESPKYSLEGIWQEDFPGSPFLVLVCIDYVCYKPDSIFYSSKLELEDKRYQVLLDESYFLEDTVFFRKSNYSEGSYLVVDDTLVFDNTRTTEKYLFELSEDFLRLTCPSSNTVVSDTLIIEPFLSSGGLPWNGVPLKRGGIFRRIKE